MAPTAVSSIAGCEGKDRWQRRGERRTNVRPHHIATASTERSHLVTRRGQVDSTVPLFAEYFLEHHPSRASRRPEVSSKAAQSRTAHRSSAFRSSWSPSSTRWTRTAPTAMARPGWHGGDHMSTRASVAGRFRSPSWPAWRPPRIPKRFGPSWRAHPRRPSDQGGGGVACTTRTQLHRFARDVPANCGARPNVGELFDEAHVILICLWLDSQ